jgi:hypothetical protein
VVSFTHRQLYPRGKGFLYPLDRRLGGPESRSGRCGVQKYLFLPGLELQPFGRPARSQALYRLPYPGSHFVSYHPQNSLASICFILLLRGLCPYNTFLCSAIFLLFTLPGVFLFLVSRYVISSALGLLGYLFKFG